MARPGMLIRPTRVAAVSCQALSPALSHAGYGITDKPSLARCHAIAHATANGMTSRHRVGGLPCPRLDQAVMPVLREAHAVARTNGNKKPSSPCVQGGRHLCRQARR